MDRVKRFWAANARAILVVLSIICLAAGARLAIGAGWDLLVLGVAGLLVAFNQALRDALERTRPTLEESEQ